MSERFIDDEAAIFHEPLDILAAHDFLADSTGRFGGVVVFVGRVRRWTDAKNVGYTGPRQSDTQHAKTFLGSAPLTYHEGREVVETPSLFYECYPEMARAAMYRLLSETRQRWELGRQLIWHRVGELPAGAAAIVIGASSSHRVAAYQANQFLIDEVKRRVPIWKQERFAAGTSLWTHPTEIPALPNAEASALPARRASE